MNVSINREKEWQRNRPLKSVDKKVWKVMDHLITLLFILILKFPRKAYFIFIVTMIVG